MSLTDSFFQERQQELERYQKQGYQALQDFLQESVITEEQLMAAGLLEVKNNFSTADLQHFQVSKQGKKFFKELKRTQLILIDEKGRTQLLELTELKNISGK